MNSIELARRVRAAYWRVFEGFHDKSEGELEDEKIKNEVRGGVDTLVDVLQAMIRVLSAGPDGMALSGFPRRKTAGRMWKQSYKDAARIFHDAVKKHLERRAS